ncbi:excalibur calcium-binding domain-containing protein [Candidatus Methylomicrobium oryzae]|uniref:excalibur calcium-binding domain-containing protein n=1 Tax=Candidatus Methylomicrobium oryzae TaxID=2802053 RepID=UPI0019249380|nr:excalibur calcium-binding domain-containing protein [Methylomicrobium sp. RS1]MBL1263891.1 excalibur calcium-binding domain-containing protein [Methylomicrobium sp. RS1]
MNRIIIILIVLGLGWYSNQKYRTHQQELLFDTSETTTDYVASSESDIPSNNSQFKCDGRTHCSQMTSCEEATFFINNCPGTKMDGNKDGIPCERQWCQ